MVSKEEKILKDRLKMLENRYRKNLFLDEDLVEKVGSDVSKDLKQRFIDRKNRIEKQKLRQKEVEALRRKKFEEQRKREIERSEIDRQREIEEHMEKVSKEKKKRKQVVKKGIKRPAKKKPIKLIKDHKKEEKRIKEELGRLEGVKKVEVLKKDKGPKKEIELPKDVESPKDIELPKDVEAPKDIELPKKVKPHKKIKLPEKVELPEDVKPPEEVVEFPEVPEEDLIEVKYSEKGPDMKYVKKSVEKLKKVKKEMSKALVGQERIVDGLLRGLLCNSHVLLEGVPGIAKTLAIKALGAATGCDVKRVQFTVDLLPTDIIGITSYTPEKGFEVVKGPIFTNFLIADEINRSPPKTQSALMESMQERQATIGRKTYRIPSPFFVMATENPLENAGVYPLPEAQVDRFLFKILMGYPEEDEEKKIMETNITLKNFEDFDLKPVITPAEIVSMQEIVKKIYLDDSIKNYILAIVKKSRNKDFKDSEYLTFGVSPRASIGVFIASKARALMNGRNYVIPEDVKKVIFDVLRHRLILSYKANLKKISPENIIQNILNEVKVN
jgi:MoxR-like ATPase